MLKNITFALFFKNTEINIIHYMILEKIDKLLNEVNNLCLLYTSDAADE